MFRSFILCLLSLLLYVESNALETGTADRTESTRSVPSLGVCVGSTTLLEGLTISESGFNDFDISATPQQIVIAPAAGGKFNITAGNIGAITVDGGVGITAAVDPSSTDGMLRVNLTLLNSEHAGAPNTLAISGVEFEGVSAGVVDILFVTSNRPITGWTNNTSIGTSVTVNGKPTGSAGTGAVCSGVQLNYDLTAQITNSAPSDFQWKAVSDVTEVEGESTETMFGSFINSTLTNLSSTPQTVEYSVIPTSTSGGCAGQEFIVIITVNPVPTAISGQRSTCNNVTANIDLQTYVDNGVPSTFSWYGMPNENISGISTSPQEGNTINDLLVRAPGKASAIYTVTATGTAGNCTGQTFSVTVSIEDPATIEAGTAQSACPGDAVTLSEATMLNAFEAQWSILAQPVGGNGNLSETGPTSFIAEVIFNAMTPGEYTLRLTSSATACPAVHDDIIITVNAPANAGLDAAASVCNSETSFNVLAALGGTPDAGGNWTDLNGSGVTFNGAKADFTAVTPGDYQLEYALEGGCPGDNSALLSVTVQPAPFAGSSADASACNNESAFDLIKKLPGANAGGTWTDVNASGAIITGDNADFRGIAPGSYDFRYIVTGSGACAGYSAGAIVAVSVKPLPLTTATNNAPVISSGRSTNITLSSNVSGAYFEYVPTAPAEITGAISGSGSPIAQTLHNSTAVPQALSYTIVATAEGCTGPQAIVNLTVRGNPTISQADSLLLVSLYQSANGAQWTINTNWLTGPANTWHGIKVTDKRATDINLSSNNLTGTIPMQIGDLAILDTLDLSNNKLTGELPATVTGLNLLHRLDVSNNQLSGPLPSALGALPGLEALFVQKNKFTGNTPTSLATCTTLRQLNLSDNLLTSLPNLSNLTLTTLDVSKNKLTFATLEPNMSISAMIYAPQDSVGLKKFETVQTTTPYTITATVDGTANHYQWKKNGVAINGATASTYTLTSPVFADEGIYTFEVTNTLLPNLTLQGRPLSLKVSSLRRDSLSLVQLYEATGGTAWTNKTGWLEGRLTNWNGVTVSSNRVTAINLVNNNLTGKVPAAISDMLSLTSINVSNNKITQLPNITPLKQLATVNVSGNRLDFASLEPNASILNVITYSNQADLGTSGSELRPAGTSYSLSVTAGGTSNVYQWKLNNTAVNGASANQYNIPSLNRSNMGEYVCEVTNTVVPGLTLKSAPKIILATSDLSGKLLVNATTPATQGIVTLLRITASDGYDTIQVNNVNADGSFKFEQTVLADYQIVGFPNPTAYANVLPTYYKRTTLWEEADTIFVNNPVNGLDIIAEFKPADAPSGKGVIRGFVEKDDGLPAGRVMRAERIKGAGVSVRRVERTGRSKEERLILVAYVFTDENGEFEIPNLPEGEYRLNIQYPGYPMDEKSFITIPIGPALQSQVQVEARVEEGKISVRQAIVTGVAGVEQYEASVYPNPASAVINLRFGAASPWRTVSLMDISGKEIRAQEASDSETSLDIRAMRTGNYLLNIREKGIIVKTLHVVIK